MSVFYLVFLACLVICVLFYRLVRMSWQLRTWTVARSPSATAACLDPCLGHPSSTPRSLLFWACMASLTDPWLLLARLVVVFCTYCVNPNVRVVSVSTLFLLLAFVQVEIRPMMYVALTYDHRLIDGREAVTFLRKIKSVVEDPRVLLLDM